MEGFQSEVRDFVRECTGREPLVLGVAGADAPGLCLTADGRLAVVTVPLEFFRRGGAVGELIALEEEPVVRQAGDRVFLYEDRWRNDGAAVRSMLRTRMGLGFRVFARNCEVLDLSPETAADFLRRNHIYGSARARYRLGLFRRRATGMAEAGMDQTPVLAAVATFSSGIRKEDGTVSYEWVRYASVRGVRVTGGMGRLLDAFVTRVRGNGPVDVMTYADLEWYDGRSYRRLGFEPCGDRAPVWFMCRVGSGERRVCHGSGEQTAPGEVRICNPGSRKYILPVRDY
ncbi:MAG TPA: hypothetical protein IAC03_04610 [Candidatus Coprenecus pullistercoris]|nr:hypothetical protein [Candidatus Coprenecus pullistercoris]